MQGGKVTRGIALAAAFAAAAPASAATTERESVTSSGADGHTTDNGLFPYFDPGLSADGRYVVFMSTAGDLVTGDTNHLEDIFVRDRRTKVTTRVSVNAAGEQANAGSLQPSISADGRYVAFKSYASNLVAGDTNNAPDAFVVDRQTKAVTRISVKSDGGQAGVNGNETWEPRISASANAVVFFSNDADLVPNDTNNAFDCFVHEMASGKTERVNVTDAGGEQGGGCGHPDISGDGRYVVFDSTASYLTPASDDGDGLIDVYVRDRQTNHMSLASTQSTGVNTTGDQYRAAISDNGRYVVFEGTATLLVTPDDNGTMLDVFRKDLQTGEVLLVSRNSVGQQGSGGGSFASAVDATGAHVAFESDATNLVTPDPNTRDVYVRDVARGVISRVSVDSGGSSSGTSILPALNASGRYAVFQNDGVLVSNDGNAQADIYLRDSGANAPPTPAFEVSKQADGSFFVDASGSSDPDGWIEGYAWTFGDGGDATGVKGPHTYVAAGTYEIRLTVTDQDGSTASITRSVTIDGGNGDGTGNGTGGATKAGKPRLGHIPATLTVDAQGRVRVRVRCPKTAKAACRGKLLLLPRRKGSAFAGRAVTVAPGKAPKITLTLGKKLRKQIAGGAGIRARVQLRVGKKPLFTRSTKLVGAGRRHGRS